MQIIRTAMASAALGLAVVATASADHTAARVVTRDTARQQRVTVTPANTDATRLVSVVTRPASDPLHRPGLVEVRVAHTTIYLDPTRTTFIVSRDKARTGKTT